MGLAYERRGKNLPVFDKFWKIFENFIRIFAVKIFEEKVLSRPLDLMTFEQNLKPLTLVILAHL